VKILNGASDADSGVSDWSADANNTSDWGWVYFHQGGRYDSTTKLYSFRHRDYSPTLQRWMQEDPMGYVNGMNSYEYVQSAPSTKVDALGLRAWPTQTDFSVNLVVLKSVLGDAKAGDLSFTWDLEMILEADEPLDLNPFHTQPFDTGVAGQIVQHVHGFIWWVDGGGSYHTITQDYWEAWDVSADHQPWLSSRWSSDH